MINTYRKANVTGAATLIMTVIVLTVATLIIVFSATYSRFESTATANMTRNQEAFAAAEAGLEYAINYLDKNYSTVIANPVNGYIPVYTNALITNVVLANNSKFTVVYTNPTASNYKLIEITSTGTSADGTATHSVSQQVQMGSILLYLPSSTLSMGGSIAMSGSAKVYNVDTSSTLDSGSTVSFSGASSTITGSGGSNKSHISSDITQNSSDMQGGTSAILNDFFGTDSLSMIKNNFEHQYTSSGSTNYSSTLAGMTGTSIWIDQTGSDTVTLNGNTNLGTTGSPVILVVNNGTLSMTGSVAFSGFIFALGTNSAININGNATTEGAMVGTGAMTVSGSASLSYSSTVLSNLQNLSSMAYFAKVAGTWRDF